jgi:hypothetical protein
LKYPLMQRHASVASLLSCPTGQGRHLRARYKTLDPIDLLT